MLDLIHKGGVVKMLDLIHKYANGFVAIPTALACRRKKLFAALKNRPSALDSLAQHLRGNPGHLLIALRLLQSLRLLDCDSGGIWSLSEKSSVVDDIPEDIDSLLAVDIPAALAEGNDGNLDNWLARSESNWGASDGELADLLDGVLAVPLMIGINGAGGSEALEATLKTGKMSEWIREKVQKWFIAKKWGDSDGGAFRLNPTGRFLIERSMLNGVTASYGPMLRRVGDLLFGDPGDVFCRTAASGETHIDRALNVIASGFQHEKYFIDLTRIIRSVFDAEPFENQPTHIADMGCGDATLLRGVYQVICDQTLRGRALDCYPLTLIGVDLNPAALAAASRTLTGLPHLLLEGDISDPLRLAADLQRQGIDIARGVLHIRSFLDHDRNWRPPREAAASEQFCRLRLSGTYVDQAGNTIPGALAMQALVEHLDGWSQVVGSLGLLILEVHSVAPEILRDDPHTTNSIHFDALQSFSGQQLVEAHAFLLAAARVGLFPRVGFFRRYPRTTPYSHITLSWLEKRPFLVRLASAADLAALSELEQMCWSPPLRTPTRELAARLERCPEGNLVLELDGNVRAAIYAQRVVGVEVLFTATAAEASHLHKADGSVVQLLALNTHPDFQHHGLGNHLLHFTLHYLSVMSGVTKVVGVTRCKAYAAHRHMPIDEYLRQREDGGQLVDPILRFHEQHGATILRLVPGYRPEDEENLGNGILIQYDLLGRESSDGLSAPAESQSGTGDGLTAEVRIKAAVQRVLGVRSLADSAGRIPLMELGLDSLGLQELLLTLNRDFGTAFDSTLFFRCSTIDAIAECLRTSEGKCSTPQTPKADNRRSSSPDRVSAPVTVDADSRWAVEPIAIIGMGCRFPGGVGDPESFWRLLAQGTDVVGKVPPDRWDADALYDPDPESPGKMWSRAGGFLERIDQFDAAFFGISPREAMSMDPQQRLLLEVTWEAFEHAGIAPESLAGAPVGVFVGLSNLDYQRLAFAHHDQIDAYCATGTFASTASGRLSYFFGFHGPCLTVDTACSSSLVAVHLACQSLQQAESDVAIVGGVSLVFPEYSIDYTKARMLSPSDRCKTFDASADGYVRGEGCGVLVLKLLAKAQADGDRILGVILGTGINQDGRSNGLTAPNGRAQEQLLRQVLRRAGIAPGQVSYVEAHGTATPLGDLVEIGALTAVLGEGRATNSPLLVGSVKTNIGHLEAASGIAGIIKTVLALQHRRLPPHLHFKALNPQIPTHGVKLLIPRNSTLWEPVAGRYIAGVSGFGFSGTNAHVLLEAPRPTPVPEIGSDRSRHILCLSAKTESALRALVERYDAYLADCEESLADVCFTANRGRCHLAYRFAATGSSAEEMRERLAAYLSSPVEPRKASSSSPRLAFLFTGQGSQYAHMGKELYATQPTFRRILDRCDEILRPLLPRPLLSVIYPDDASRTVINQTGFTQPALFALEYALAELWRSWGIVPDLVLGHSVGEYVAACLAGVFSLEDGLRLIAERARLIQSLPPSGRMAAVFAPADMVVHDLLRDWRDEVDLAAVNGPKETLIAGSVRAVDAILDKLRVKGIRSQLLAVTHAFHSPLMEPILEDFRLAAQAVEYAAPRLPIVSNLTGRLYDMAAPTDADYWVNHMRHTVMFMASLQTADGRGVSSYLEVGPSGTLINLARRNLAGQSGLWLQSLKPGMSDWTCLLESAAALYTSGKNLDWQGFDPDYSRSRVSVPTYAFQRQRYWLDQRSRHQEPAAAARANSRTKLHPLLGHRMTSPLVELQFENFLDLDHPAFLADHCIRGRSYFPAAAYVELALAAAGQRWPESSCSLVDFEIHQALSMSEGRVVLLHSIVGPINNDAAAFSCFAKRAEAEDNSSWIKLATGILRPQPGPAPQELSEKKGLVSHPSSIDGCSSSFDGLKTQCELVIDVDAYYESLKRRGYLYGPAFRGLTRLLRGRGCALADVHLPEGNIKENDKYHCHPALLDACLQTLLASASLDDGRLYVPVGWDKFSWFRRETVSEARCLAISRTRADHPLDLAHADLFLFDPGGASIAAWEGLRLRDVEKTAAQYVPELPRAVGALPEEPSALCPSNGRSLEIEAELRKALAEIMALPSPDSVDSDDNILGLGMDSLMLMDFQIAVENIVGKRLPKEALDRHETLRKLVNYLEALMVSSPAAEAKTASASS
jgi:acyl transferase domain-containing protein